MRHAKANMVGSHTLYLHNEHAEILSVQAAEDGRGNGAAVPSIFILKGKIVKLGGHLAA